MVLTGLLPTSLLVAAASRDLIWFCDKKSRCRAVVLLQGKFRYMIAGLYQIWFSPIVSTIMANDSTLTLDFIKRLAYNIKLIL